MIFSIQFPKKKKKKKKKSVLKHLDSGRLTAAACIGDELWLGASGALSIMSKEGKWLKSLSMPQGVNVLVTMLPIGANKVSRAALQSDSKEEV